MSPISDAGRTGTNYREEAREERWFLVAGKALEIATILNETSESKKKAYMRICQQNPTMIPLYEEWSKEFAANPKAKKNAALFW